jgi:uncharacterized protein (TIGR03000 family)
MYSFVLMMALTAPQDAAACGCYGYTPPCYGYCGYVAPPIYYGCCGPVIVYSCPATDMQAPKVITPDEDKGKKITPDEDKGKKITPDKDEDKDKGKKITPDKNDKKQDDNKDDKKNNPDKNTSADAPAFVLVSVPADATLVFNGEKTKSRSSERRFVSPPLQKGYSYSYTVEATLIREGTPRTITRTVYVVAGQTSRLTINFAEAPSVASR